MRNHVIAYRLQSVPVIFALLLLSLCVGVVPAYCDEGSFPLVADVSLNELGGYVVGDDGEEYVEPLILHRGENLFICDSMRSDDGDYSLGEYDYDKYEGNVFFIDHQRYTGSEIKPLLSVYYLDEYGDLESISSLDYTASYESNIEGGTASVTLTGLHEYVFSVTITFKIKYDLEDATVDELPNQRYTGKEITPNPVVRFNGSPLELGVDYSISYEDNVDATDGDHKSATIWIEGRGDYMGSTSAEFKIVKTSIAKAKVSKIKTQVLGTKKFSIPTVKLNGIQLKPNQDFYVEYDVYDTPGKAYMTVHGIGLYTGEVKKSFKVIANMKDAEIEYVGYRIETGKKITPKPKITFSDETLKRGRDYTLSYKKNIKPGTATITAKGKGLYRGKVSKTFKIIAKGTGSTITRAEFNRIRMNMTYSEAKRVIGGQGKLVRSYAIGDAKYKIYRWEGKRRYSFALVSFQDGEVNSKSQTGI